MPPRIGLTLDYQETSAYAQSPWFALRRNYVTCVEEHGAIPLPLVPHETLCAPYINLMDGLVVTGGGFHIDPRLYGEKPTSDKIKTNPLRTIFELRILQLAMDIKMPILGICGGMQALNVVLGGTLIQNIPEAHPEALDHDRGFEASKGSHTITPQPSTLLARLVGEEDVWVNTSHTQAVKDVAQGCVVNAYATDGIIEAIHVPSQPFCLGVQWHPEYLCSEADVKIFKAFVEACRSFAHSRER